MTEPNPEEAGRLLERIVRWANDNPEIRGLALNDGNLYVPVFFDNKIFVVDKNSGGILSSATVESPRGMAAREGKVYVISKTSLFQVDAKGALTGAPIVTGLDGNVWADATVGTAAAASARAKV